MDWLVQQAGQGNADALKTLQARHPEKNTKYNGFDGVIQNNTAFLNPERDSITKQGTVIYHQHDTSIRDNGKQIFMPYGYTKEGLKEALKMAIKRYGESITIHGDMRFKADVVNASLDLNIQFSDKTLQAARQKLLQQRKLREKHHARRIRGSHARRSAQGIRSNARIGGVPYGRFTRKSYQPHVGGIGRKPPSIAQNCLRNLSELGMVQLASRSEMLLQGHVSHHLEYQRAQSNDPLRRGVSRAGVKGLSRAEIKNGKKIIR